MAQAEHCWECMVDEDLYRQFEEWFKNDTANDQDFTGETAHDYLVWARRRGCLDEILNLPERSMSLREYLKVNFLPNAQSPHFRDRGFRGRRKKGGEHDLSH